MEKGLEKAALVNAPQIGLNGRPLHHPVQQTHGTPERNIVTYLTLSPESQQNCIKYFTPHRAHYSPESWQTIHNKQGHVKIAKMENSECSVFSKKGSKYYSDNGDLSYSCDFNDPDCLL